MKCECEFLWVFVHISSPLNPNKSLALQKDLDIDDVIPKWEGKIVKTSPFSLPETPPKWRGRGHLSCVLYQCCVLHRQDISPWWDRRLWLLCLPKQQHQGSMLEIEGSQSSGRRLRNSVPRLRLPDKDDLSLHGEQRGIVFKKFPAAQIDEYSCFALSKLKFLIPFSCSLCSDTEKDKL